MITIIIVQSFAKSQDSRSTSSSTSSSSSSSSSSLLRRPRIRDPLSDSSSQSRVCVALM